MAEELSLARGSVLESTGFEMKEDKGPSETEVIARVKKGDKEAYHFIVTRYMQRAYYIALGFVHNPQDALDISQEAFIKAFRKIKKFDSQRPFFPWFYQLMKNLCFDHLRRCQRWEEVPLDGVRILKTEKDDREMKKILWKGIETLPQEQKEVIILRYLQQYSYQEIADILGKPLGTIMSSLYYAKVRLKKILGKYLCLE
jgi:RNA polymerase sigma-70 factor (ECF subfamily)